MSDTIYREDAIKAVDAFLGTDSIVERIKRLPSADKPQGEWIYCEDYVGQDGYKCSECGFFAPWHYDVYDIDYISDYHYCPNCGARMKGADDD